MRRLGTKLAALTATWMLPASAFAVQFTLADETVNHTQATGAYVSITSGAPADLTAPDDYATGMLHHRVTVNTIPATANTTTYKVCFVQGANTACSNNAISFDAAGAFEASQAMNTLTNYAMIDWTMPLDDVEVVAMDAGGIPVDATEDMWVGNPNYALYYPLDLLYEAVVVASGDMFEGYPSDSTGTAAEAPAIAPNGGTFEGSVDVSFDSGTADSTIYYTTDGSDPDDTSTAYDGTPVTITSDTTVKAITYADGLDPSPITEASFTIVAQLNSGLRGRYYNNTDFTDLISTRTDPSIDFEYGDGNPPFADQGNQYAMIWTGQVTPRYSNNYTFKTVNDDGARLWVNDQLVIDDWNFHGPQEQTGNVSLQAGQPVSIWLEYFNGGGGGTISLGWESDEQPNEIIPDTQLDPNLPANFQTSVSLLVDQDEGIPETQMDPVIIQLSRRGDIDTQLSVDLTYGGTATNGTDFNQLPGSVTFAAGELTKNLELIPINDDEVEEYEETITITIADGNGYTASDPTTVELILLDDDVNVFGISGTIIYTGTESGRIIVEAFREEDPVFLKRQESLLNPGPYGFENLEPGEYNVIAYIDANDNESLDETEIWGIYQDAALQPALVTIPPPAMGIDINLDVAPGEDPAGGDGKGCCATVSGSQRSAPIWLAALLGFVALGLRRRR